MFVVDPNVDVIYISPVPINALFVVDPNVDVIYISPVPINALFVVDPNVDVIYISPVPINALFVVDPNVDVIYISPVPINEEQQQYYSKLLGLKTAIDSGNVEDQGSLQDRYKIIVPESINSFPVSTFLLVISK